jgi:hypothetical protein
LDEGIFEVEDEKVGDKAVVERDPKTQFVTKVKLLDSISNSSNEDNYSP